MSIFILEDDIIQAENLKKVIQEICEKHEIRYDFIFSTSKGERIIERISTTSMNAIYFLDIEINKEAQKGFRVAQNIRELDDRGIIVFITTHSEFAPISYQYMVSALTFIDKGLPYDQRYMSLVKCLLKYQKSNTDFAPVDDFILENNHSTVRVPFSEIEYFMTAESHRLQLITHCRVISFYGKLAEVENKDERLIRCHQSYIVNLEEITEIDTKERLLKLKSGATIPVSRRLVRKVHTSWKSIVGKRR